jgi:Ni/Fe-hydrogenase 1 B-type cytochrome subunit
MPPVQSLALIAESGVTRSILSQVDTIAPSDSSVLLIGETGVGKELIAECIHQTSPRQNRPFVMVGLSALPRELLKSALFGRERGASPSTSSEKKGLLELAATGYLIGSALAVQASIEASFGYWFGTVRFIHFVAAFVFFFNFAFRIFRGFVGNKYADWRNLILYRKDRIEEIKEVLAVDIFQARGKPLESVGHNPLAGFTYFVSFLAFLFQRVTGFGLYAAMSHSWLAGLFAWVVPLMGGGFAVRQWHHLMVWFFLIFAMVHVFLVFYHDYAEGRGVTSSMVGGWKFIEKQNKK